MRKIDIEVYDDFVSPTYLSEIQKATDRNIKIIEDLFISKEQEILKV